MSMSYRTADQSEVRQEQKVVPSQHEEDQTVHLLPLSVGMGQGTRNQRPYATKAAMRNRSTVRHSHPVPPQVRHCGTAQAIHNDLIDDSPGVANRQVRCRIVRFMTGKVGTGM